MAYLAKAKKVDLLELSKELGFSVTEEARIVDLKDIITQSEKYDEEFTKELLSRITDDRIASENAAKELADRQFELAKLKIENGIQDVNISNENSDNRQNKNVHVDFRDLMHKYNIKDGDINFYLVLFERQARRASLSKEHWVSHLLGLLPYEITQLIARENEENANDYDYVKSLLLKRYKLSADKFRFKFLNHVRNLEGTWKDFSFELKNYFQEWLSGLEISDFHSLKNLIITEQLKKHVNATTREHFVDQWSKFNNPDELADKLDNYDSVRSNNSSKNKNVPNYPPFDKLQVERKQTTFHENKNREQRKIDNSNIRNDKGEFKCFRCNNYGHISRDCLEPRIIFCKTCNKEGHSQRTCKLNCSEKQESNDLTVSQNYSVSNTAMAPTNYLKDTFIYGYKVKALCDTGSSSCLLKESIALKLNLDILPDNSELFGFGNKSKPVTRAVGKAVVNIRVDDVVGKRITLLIVKDESQPYDLILGRTLIDLPYIAFARIDGNLKFGYANSDVFSKIQEDMRENSFELETVDEVEIKSNSINLIEAKMVEGENSIYNGVSLVESIGQNFDSILKVVNDETNVPVINKENFNLKIRKNQCLGRGVEINEECSLLPNLSNNKENKAEETVDKQVLMMQHSDHDSRKIIEIFKKKDYERSNEEKQMIEGYVFKKNKIYRKFKTKEKEILPMAPEKRPFSIINVDHFGPFVRPGRGNKDWDLKVKDANRNLNNADDRKQIEKIVFDLKKRGTVSETKSSPVLLVKKKTGERMKHVDALSRSATEEPDDSAKEWIDTKEIREDAKEMIEAEQNKMKAYYDKRKCKTVNYDKGEIVVMRKTPQATGQPLKTQPKCKGPSTITEVLPGDTYRVAQLEEKEKGHFYNNCSCQSIKTL